MKKTRDRRELTHAVRDKNHLDNSSLSTSVLSTAFEDLLLNQLRPWGERRDRWLFPLYGLCVPPFGSLFDALRLFGNAHLKGAEFRVHVGPLFFEPAHSFLE